MTQDEIIEMAKQAGLDIDSWEPLYEGGLTGFGVYECTHEELERFAKLVAQQAQAKEREACAKVCDDINAVYNKPEDSAERVASQWCAERIRVRGDNK